MARDEAALGIDGAPIPFWAFAWAGGLALARTCASTRTRCAGDGSWTSPPAAASSRSPRPGGCRGLAAADIDPFAEAAVALNARANGVHLAFLRRDLLDEPPPAVDVLLAADTWYEGPAGGARPPLAPGGGGSGVRVLVGDPGRRYLPDPPRPASRSSPATTSAPPPCSRTATLVEARVFALGDAPPR